MTMPGRFTSRAATPSSTPMGVSSREGWLLIGWACFQLLMVAVLFQLANVPNWSGLVMFASLGVLIAGQAVWAVLVARARRVHPRGFNALAVASGVWATIVVLVAGWFWIAHGPHPTPALVTTLTALIALAPSIGTGARLVMAVRPGRRR